MAIKILAWTSLVSVILLSLFGFHFYFSLVVFLVSCITGIITVIYFSFDEKKLFQTDLNYLDNPLDETNFSVNIPKIQKLFNENKQFKKFDQRITGSETVDSFLNEIINIIISDYVCPWYEILTDDNEFKKYSVRQTSIETLANFSNRIKSVDWVQLLSTKFPEELITHLKLFKQSRVRLKHLNYALNKEATSTASNPSRLSPKRGDEGKGHRRNKSDTDVGWFVEPQAQVFGKSKFYGSNDSLDGKTISEIFFNLESLMEDRVICRDIYCLDPDKEKMLLSEVSEALLYLVAPEDAWKCHSLKTILIDLVSSVVLKPIIEMITDPDNINRLIIRTCLRESGLPTELFLTVIRYCEDAEELDATIELVQKEIQKLVNENAKKMEEAIKPSLQFLSATSSWRSNAQYLIEIELCEPESSQNSKELLKRLRSSALELCDNYLAPNKAPLIGVPENTYQDLVGKLSVEDEEFDANPSGVFDELHKNIFEALEEFLQGGDNDSDDTDASASDNSTANSLVSLRENSPKLEQKRTNSAQVGDLSPSVSLRHNRSHSDVGNANKYNEKINKGGLLTAVIIETALVQEKGKTFGIYAIAVKRLSDGEEWHIYRRYSDFHDLHSSIKDVWPELSSLPFPGKKTFQNTSRALLEKRKVMLNNYLQTLTQLSKDRRFQAIMDDNLLGGFLNPQNQSDRHASSIDALLVNSLRAGMRTLKNMPDQFANTVDGVMDGISKVFQGKSDEDIHPEGIKSGNSSDAQEDGVDSVGLRLFEEILGLRGLWLRRRLLAPVRTILADKINKKVLELVAVATSPRNIVQYLKYLKNWLTNRSNTDQAIRDASTKARTRVAAKVALLVACSDDLRHIVGQDASRRGILTVFELFQKQDINRRLVFVLLEATLKNLFPDNNMQELFKKLYSMSPRASQGKRSAAAV